MGPHGVRWGGRAGGSPGGGGDESSGWGKTQQKGGRPSTGDRGRVAPAGSGPREEVALGNEDSPARREAQTVLGERTGFAVSTPEILHVQRTSPDLMLVLCGVFS